MIRPEIPDVPIGRYELRINGEKLGDFDDLADVYAAIEWEYGLFADRYTGEVFFHLEDWGGPEDAPLRVARARLSGGIWDALCEDAQAFSMWLDALAWQTPSDARSGPRGRQGGTDGR